MKYQFRILKKKYFHDIKYQNDSCLFTFFEKNDSSLFTFFEKNDSSLFKSSKKDQNFCSKWQLFVYIFAKASAVCLHLNLTNLLTDTCFKYILKFQISRHLIWILKKKYFHAKSSQPAGRCARTCLKMFDFKDKYLKFLTTISQLIRYEHGHKVKSANLEFLAHCLPLADFILASHKVQGRLVVCWSSNDH